VLRFGWHIDGNSWFQPMGLPKEFYLPNPLQAEEDLHLRLVLII
jgi:hypothetical protein